jgi:hypothetical protein
MRTTRVGSGAYKERREKAPPALSAAGVEVLNRSACQMRIAQCFRAILFTRATVAKINTVLRTATPWRAGDSGRLNAAPTTALADGRCPS